LQQNIKTVEPGTLMKEYPIERFLEILSRVLSDSEFSNIKHQIPNKFQIPTSNVPNRFGILNFAHLEFFVICDLEFYPRLKSFLFDQTGRFFRPEAALNLK
jgi:hypothetical protein